MVSADATKDNATMERDFVRNVSVVHLSLGYYKADLPVQLRKWCECVVCDKSL